jgi:putative membrane protein
MKQILVALLLMIAPSAFAQSVGEKTGVNEMLDKPPTGSDVLLGIHQFDLFQQEVADSADKRGDTAIRKFTQAQSDAAETRGHTLDALKKKTGLDVKFPEDPDAMRSNRLGGLDGSVAEGYVRGFYKAETAEHESAISLLKRYLAKPDNDDVRAFAKKQLPVLESGLGQVQSASK